ncbi:MAG: carotenoid 1,2-hydratase, partial [Myxococcota bacterium]
MFLGSVFSPYYFRARRRPDPPPAEEHAAFNCVLYRERGRIWTFTERGARHVERSEDGLRVGPSRASWDGHTLTVDLVERACPVPSRVRGQIRVELASTRAIDYPLDAAGRHHWRPIDPCARVAVDFDRPDCRWRGHAYVDGNRGDRALETDFDGWDWCRLDGPGGGTRVFYDLRERGADPRTIALDFAAAGSATPAIAPKTAGLDGTGWRVARTVRSEGTARVVRTLEDTPFYARSIVETRLEGEPVRGVHESLDLRRFGSTWVQCLLPFR